MRLIIGGAYQGKRQYAREHYGGEIIGNFHLFILELVKKGEDPALYVKTHLTDYKDKTIISDDISCGVVPEDALMRKWREETGRALVILAGEADEVIRVFCGLGTRLK